MVGYTALPSRNASPASSGGETAQAKPASDTEPAVVGMESLKLPCREIERRIVAFLTTKNGATSGYKLLAPDNCYQKPGKHDSLTSEEEKNPPELRFIIATLPNPIHTHFSLEFDRTADALQQAAQDQGYNYDSSWLPWVEHPRQYGSLQDQKSQDAQMYFQEKQPGLLVFRKALPGCSPQDGAPKVRPQLAVVSPVKSARRNGKTSTSSQPEAPVECVERPYPEGLLVFVVGENPTGGIDGVQFENAVSWIKALRPRGTGRTLRILSPFFSGSFPSLARLLASEDTATYIGLNKKSIPGAASNDNLSAVEVFSGNASSEVGIRWFANFLEERHPRLGRFITFQESDDLLINRYCRLLKLQGYDTGRMAIISEDETAYGAIGSNAQVAAPNPTQSDTPNPSLYECIQHVGEGTHGPLNLYYPRDIAALRSAYEKQSVFSSQQSGRVGLPENLSEADSSEHDTIRSYGGDQTPLSQESTLFALVNLLKAHHIEFIVLRSSNGLDQIFLTQFFARTYPDARVVILNSDLMFRRSTHSPGFRGTMTLSTYPLLTWQQDWTSYQTPESRHSHRTFPDANAEGIYIASRFLIHMQNSELSLDTQKDTPFNLQSSDPDNPARLNSSVLLQDYGPPSWLLKDTSESTRPTRPPTWLSVLGSGQGWPIAVIDEDIIPEGSNLPQIPNPPDIEEEKSGRGSSVRQSTLRGDLYFVRTTYFAPEPSEEKRRQSSPSVQRSIRISTNSTLIVKPPAARPDWATGYEVYIGNSSSSETLQARVTGWNKYSQKTPLVRGAALPTGKAPDRSALMPAYTVAPFNDADLLLLPMSIRVCFSIGFMWCLWHLYCCWNGSQTATPRSRAYFAPLPGPQHNILIFFGCMLFALLAIVMATLTGAFAAGVSPFMHEGRMTLFYSLLPVLSIAALVGNYRKPPRGRRTDKRNAEEDAEKKYQDARTKEELIKALEAQEEAERQNEKMYIRRAEERVRYRSIWRVRCIKKLRHQIHLQTDKLAQWIRQHPRKWALVGALFYLIVAAVLAWIFYSTLVAHTIAANRVFSYWRSVNLFTGVSPLMPLLLLIVGMYGWFWYTLTGLALFNQDRPLLPSTKDLEMRLVMFSRERAGNKIERLAKPLSGGYGMVLPGLFLGLVLMFLFFARSDDFALRSLGAKNYGIVFFVWLCVCITLIVADGFQMLRIWSRLRQLLVFLDRIPLRRTLHAMKGFSWGTVWKMSGSVLELRYKLLSRQMESFRHLKNELQRLAEVNALNQGQPRTDPSQIKPKPPDLKASFYKRLDTCDASSAALVAWYINSYRDPLVTDLSPVQRHQEELAETAAAVCNSILLPRWTAEHHSLVQDPSQPGVESGGPDKPELSLVLVPEFQRLAEEFFLLPYLGFIQNILGRMRTIVMGMLWLFITATISVASYPFDPRPLLAGIFLFVFVLVGTIVIFVYAGMHRDSTLSYITNTNPGELGMDFWLKLIGIGVGPLIALLTAMFPETASFITSWLQPGIQAIK
jgi:hypothetical protein